MRSLVIALVIAAVASPTMAQGMRGGGKKSRQALPQVSEEQKKKAKELEKAANSALSTLPDQKYDPWRNAR